VLSPVVLLGWVLLDPWRRLRSAVEISLIAVWAIVLAFLALLPLWFPDTVQARPLWRALYAAVPPGIYGLTLGLYDHITLTRLIPKVPAEDAHE
jgi:hypothetical protein